MSNHVLREKGKPFPYRGVCAISPKGVLFRGCCCAACRVGTPYSGAYADSPERVPCRGCCCPERRGRRSLPRVCEFAVGSKRPPPFPPPAGEGVAHKGDRRGRTWRDRDVEMTATVELCERLYSQQAATFSLFRHPPRGGSADATFPRWGKEIAAANSPEVILNLCRMLRGMSRTPSPTGEVLRIRRRAYYVVSAAARRAGSARPTTERMRIRRRACHVVGAAARNAGDGVPYRPRR